jgi:predicted cobalt transporter CbtA
MVVRDLLVRGMLAGVLAGVLALGFAELVGEPQVSRAIAVETRVDQQAGKTPDPVLVSRTVQKTIGLATAVLVIGTTLGGLFALAFAFAYGRISRQGPRATAALLAGAGFCSIFLVPFLKYPANPPSVGNPDTIGYRTQLYFAMILISAVAAVGAIVLGRRLADRYTAWNATLLAAGAFAAFIVVVLVAMPGVNEVPAQFPAVVLWRFRMASLGTQFILWTAIGLVFGALTERSVAGERRTSLSARSARR